MLNENELSNLEPFLSLERLKWKNLMRIYDDLLRMADAPRGIERSVALLHGLANQLDKPLVFRESERLFSLLEVS